MTLEMNGAAKASGISTAVFTMLTSYTVALAEPGAGIQIFTVIVSGLFGMASSLAVALLNWWLKNRKRDKD